MDAKKALSLVSREAPCPHLTVDTSLGDGKTWAKCEDCGATVEQWRLPEAKRASDEYDEAVALLASLVEDTKPADNDELQRLRFELDKLERKYRKSETMRECLVQENQALDDRVRGLQLRQFARFAEEECWIYQGDGTDNLKTLVCPVVISAADLLELQEKAGVVTQIED